VTVEGRSFSEEIFEQAHVAYLIGRGLIQKLLTWLLWGAPLYEKGAPLLLI
jgi:hypothetical protein